jgi:lipopolysaccharide transport system permease protein
VLVFGKIAGMSTDGLPQILFYLSGIVIWNYFSEVFNTTAKTFTENKELFGKVYFPRLVSPLSKVVSGLIKFAIQFSFFLAIYCYFLFSSSQLSPNLYILTAPLLVVIMAGLGLGFGIIFTSLTTKYRDLVFVVQFGVQLLMYATPVIYPVSAIPDKYKFLIQANPLTPIMEGFRFAFMGAGEFSWMGIGYSCAFTAIILLFGILIFNRVEKTFMDTV